MHIRGTLRAVCCASLLAAACGPGPWQDPALNAYVSAELPPCEGEPASCDPLVASPADSAVLHAVTAWGGAGATALARATGVEWHALPKRAGPLHVDFGAVDSVDQSRVRYVAEVVQALHAQDTVLSIASNGGTVVWLNGERLGASRQVGRAARAHQDLYTVPLRPGANVVLYKVRTQSYESQLHREWHGSKALPRLLTASIQLGAYSDLPVTALLDDSATHVALDPPQVRLRNAPLIRFEWKTLSGEPLAAGGEFRGAYPERLPLPAGFDGMAVLRVQVRDRGGELYLEELPVFRAGRAAQLARELAQRVVMDDPVRTARVEAVRAAWALDTAAQPFGPWHQTHTLADLYRHVAQPDAFQHHPGPQVWGYRAADGSVQPYWLVVPPSAADPRAPRSPPPGLVFSLTHMVNPSFWLGRGRSDGWLIHMNAISATIDDFGVLPHLRGSHDFDTIAVEEFTAITKQVDSVFGIDTAAIGLLAWSLHARETVELARDPRVPLGWMGFAVPWFIKDPQEFGAALDSIRAVRPGVRWLVWRAQRDTDIPRERQQQWVDAMRGRGFDVVYREVPYSTHLGGFFQDIEAELHARMAARGTNDALAARPRADGVQ